MNHDKRDANKTIRTNRHVIPMIEKLRHDLNGATIFSVMNQNCGYNLYQLAERLSRDITAFRTHQGIKTLNDYILVYAWHPKYSKGRTK